MVCSCLDSDLVPRRAVRFLGRGRSGDSEAPSPILVFTCSEAKGFEALVSHQLRLEVCI